MRLLVLSDIHGQESVLHNILRYEMNSADRLDLVLFLGDGLREFEALSYSGEFAQLPILSVRGNCDFFGSSDTPEFRELTFFGKRIGMMHGHRFDVKCGTDRAAAFALSSGQDLLLYGHTHVPSEIHVPRGNGAPSLILFNPGAARGGRYGVVTVCEDGIVCEHRQK